MSKQPTYTFRISPGLKARAIKAAKKDRRTLPDWVRKVVEEAAEQSETTSK
jgi:predicted HicB family RNase H-like nuclease